MAKPPAPRASRLGAERVRGRIAAPVRVRYQDEAHKFVRRTGIHTRRIIPPVPAGDDVADPRPTRAAAPAPPRLAEARGIAGRRAAADELVVLRNVPLDDAATQDTASHVCEPSCAIDGQVVFYTGNWFAAVSVDGGRTFRWVDPATSFPDPQGMSFCCDQVVHYIKKIDTFVWLLQYNEDPRGENIQRLAFATSADVARGRWRTFDLTPNLLGVPGLFLDFPDIAVGSNMLYVTTNGFRGPNWEATILVRLPLAGIRSGQVTAQRTISRDNFNFRVAQHCTTTAYWASHETTSRLRVYAWRERDAQPSFRDVAVPTWSDARPLVSRGPDQRNWLARADSRLLGATKAGSELWFTWGSDRGGVNARPQPFVQIARIDSRTFALVESINLWDPQSAIFYASLATNTAKEVGVTYAIGGGPRHPSHAVGLLTGRRRDVVMVEGKRGPSDSKWGDYLTVRRHNPKGRWFATAGYTLQPGGGAADSTPHFAVFCRGSDK
jgi:hypothetical protein